MVVLPAPLGPTSAASWPGRMSRSTPSSVHSRGAGRARRARWDAADVRSGPRSGTDVRQARRPRRRLRAQRDRVRSVGDLRRHVEVLEDAVEQRHGRLDLGGDLQHRPDREEQPRLQRGEGDDRPGGDRVGVPDSSHPDTRYTRAGVIEKNVPTTAKNERPIIVWRICRPVSRSFSPRNRPVSYRCRPNDFARRIPLTLSVSSVMAVRSASVCCVFVDTARRARPTLTVSHRKNGIRNSDSTVSGTDRISMAASVLMMTTTLDSPLTPCRSRPTGRPPRRWPAATGSHRSAWW